MIRERFAKGHEQKVTGGAIYKELGMAGWITAMVTSRLFSNARRFRCIHPASKGASSQCLTRLPHQHHDSSLTDSPR